MKKYLVYYLPNAIRDYGDGGIMKGKVGMTSKTIEHRNYFNQYEGLDTSGFKVLVSNIDSKEEAKELEIKYQTIFNCLDHFNHPQVRKKAGLKISLVKTGVSQNTGVGGNAKGSKKNTGVGGNSKGSKKPKIGEALRGKKDKIIKCPHCNKEGGSVMKRWHFNNCKILKA